MAKQPNENKDTPNVNLLKFQQELEELAKEVLAMEGKGFFAKLGLGKKREKSHQLLEQIYWKLLFYGVTKKLISWFLSYLVTHKTKLSGCSWLDVHCKWKVGLSWT